MSDQTTTTEVIGEPMDDPKDLLRQAREMIPVGANGLAPVNFAQQIEFAQAMAKARVSIPDHLQGNVGDCLAIIDIASRAGLSPYMLALMTYCDPKSKKLAFMSQAYHALAQNYLFGDLGCTYEGEGEERVCVVYGYLKHDPTVRREHRSPPLKDVRPKRNAEGVTKGSPLWDRKPDVQLFYDTSRDWIRMFAPKATMGIRTADDNDDYDPSSARDITGEVGLQQRLINGTKSDEGHRDGHAASELDQIAPGRAEVKPADKPKPDKAKTKSKTKAKQDDKPAETKDEPKPADGPPKTAAEYVAQAKVWIAAAESVDAAMKRWEEERDLRDELQVKMKDRETLQEKIRNKG